MHRGAQGGARGPGAGAQGARGEQAAWGPAARGRQGGIRRESRGSGLPGVGGEGTPGTPWEWAARGDGVHPTVVHPDEGEYMSTLHRKKKRKKKRRGREDICHVGQLDRDKTNYVRRDI